MENEVHEVIEHSEGNVEEIQETQETEVPIDINQTQSDDNFDNSVTFHSKGKYYKQTYRSAWEQMPDFKGWLRGVQGEPTRAYCTYCQKTLHAHRLSLLKHTCTIRHQKAAQFHISRRNQSILNQDVCTTLIINDNLGQEDMENEVEETIIPYAVDSVTEMEEAEAITELEQQHEDLDEEEEEEETVQYTVQSVIPFQKQLRKLVSTNAVVKQESGTLRQQLKPALSTQVLDSTRGAPVAGLQVSLYKLIDGRWTYINEGTTSSEGRFGQFIEYSDFTPGRYKLHYDVDRYFEARQLDSLYPFIEIVMDCKGNESYHIPLVISPYGYTTSRGS